MLSCGNGPCLRQRVDMACMAMSVEMQVNCYENGQNHVAIAPLLLSLKSVCQLLKYTNPTDTIEDQRERSRSVNGNRVQLVLKDFEY